MKIIIRYKNGFELPVECESFQIETDVCNNLNGYRIKGIKGNKPLYISMGDVLCIWREDFRPNCGADMKEVSE